MLPRQHRVPVEAHGNANGEGSGGKWCLSDWLDRYGRLFWQPVQRIAGGHASVAIGKWRDGLYSQLVLPSLEYASSCRGGSVWSIFSYRPNQKGAGEVGCASGAAEDLWC